MSTIDLAAELEHEQDVALVEMGNAAELARHEDPAVRERAATIYREQSDRFRRAVIEARRLRRNDTTPAPGAVPTPLPSTRRAGGTSLPMTRVQALRIARDLVQADLMDWGGRYAGGAHIGDARADEFDRNMVENRKAVVRHLDAIIEEQEG